jgi:hypothetical protein
MLQSKTLKQPMFHILVLTVLTLLNFANRLRTLEIFGNMILEHWNSDQVIDFWPRSCEPALWMKLGFISRTNRFFNREELASRIGFGHLKT